MPVMLRQPLTLEECQSVREWRNDPAVLPMLRTGHRTKAEQAQFYRAVICNPRSDHWYYAIEDDGLFVGMGGLTYLSRVAGQAEISLILGPASRRSGLGTRAVDALVAEAWRRGLWSVVGECYATGAQPFWSRMAQRHPVSHYTVATDGTLTWRWEHALDRSALARETR